MLQGVEVAPAPTTHLENKMRYGDSARARQMARMESYTKEAPRA